MAYTVPKTWSYKESLSSSDMNTYVRDNFIALIDRFYPVGTVYINHSNSANPVTYLGFGTWVAHAEGEAIVGKSSSGTFATAGALVGAETAPHTHTIAHTHTYSGTTSATSATDIVRRGSDSAFSLTNETHTHTYSGTTSATSNANSDSTASSTIQPSRVHYIWVRTA